MIARLFDVPIFYFRRYTVILHAVNLIVNRLMKVWLKTY
jgi:hypothetical protein